MQDLDSLLTQLREHRPAAWDQLPDFALYMDQVLNYMDRQVIRFDEADGLTAAMVNNYTKSGPKVPASQLKRKSLTIQTEDPLISFRPSALSPARVRQRVLK